MEPYYNSSLYGKGFEGIINYSNSLVDGWMANLFLLFIFGASVITLSKSEWKMPGVVAFSFFVCLIAAFILRLFTTVNELVIFILLIGLSLSIAWGILSHYGR